MVKIFCDKCGKDCDRVAYSVEVNSIHNPSPMYISDTGTPHITDNNSHIIFILCQDCYRDIGLPNIYSSIRNKKICWRDNDE